MSVIVSCCRTRGNSLTAEGKREVEEHIEGGRVSGVGVITAEGGDGEIQRRRRRDQSETAGKER